MSLVVLLLHGQADEPVRELSGELGVGPRPQGGRHLRHVEPHDTPLAGHDLQQLAHLVPEEAAGLGRADRRHLRGIEGVQVDGDVHVVASCATIESGPAARHWRGP